MKIVDSVSPSKTDEAGDEQRRLNALKIRQLERIEAELRDLRQFFGLDVEELVTLTLKVNPADLLMTQRAIAGLLPGWRVSAERRYHHERPLLLERLAVKVAPDRYDFVLEFGRQFWCDADGRPGLVVDIDAERSLKEEWSELNLRVPRERCDWLNRLLPRISRWADEHHFLRGQAFDAEGEILKFDEPTAWADVFLPDPVRRALEANCIDLLAHAPLFKANGIPLKRGIILHGMPGTGKTMIGRALAQTTGVTFILSTPGMLAAPDDIRRVFRWGRRFAPSILFFEDFDMVASDRHQSNARENLGEFLNNLDGLDTGEGVITIATTNDLKAIEPALKDRPNRFDVILEIPALDAAGRRRWLERCLARQGGAIDVPRWTQCSAGFTGAQMQEFCRLAVFAAVMEVIAEPRKLEGGSGDMPGAPLLQRLPLMDKHFVAAFERMPARTRRPIGFNGSADGRQAEALNVAN